MYAHTCNCVTMHSLVSSVPDSFQQCKVHLKMAGIVRLGGKKPFKTSNAIKLNNCLYKIQMYYNYI